MTTRPTRLHRLALCAVLACPAARAGAGEGPEPKALKAAGIAVDVARREVRMDAVVCLESGMLEYLVCLEGTFEHETIFATRCRPSQLHLALLAVGLVPHPFKPDGRWWGAARLKPRSRVRIAVEYERDGKTQRRQAGDLLASREKDAGAVPDHWVFTGSVFIRDEGKERYVADYSGVVVGLIASGGSVVQYGHAAADPYKGENQGLDVNPRTVPPVGTKVKLVFSPHAAKPKPQARPRRAPSTP